MKKILILIIFLATCNHIFANLVQGSWRWRNNDGMETTATWKAAENVGIPLVSTGEILRLRYELHTSGSPIPLSVSSQLEYATVIPGGPWTMIDVTAGSNAFVMANSTGFVIQNDPTTKQLSSSPLTFLPGLIMVSSNTAHPSDLTQGQNTELEWAFKGTSNTMPGTTYYFKNAGNGTTYGTYPSVSTAPILLPVRLTDFALVREGKKIRIEWVTASEQNNDRFEILHSSNGNNWKTIVNIKGHGNTITSNKYKAYDESPSGGINYYLVKHYDVDGHSSQSDVKFLKMPLRKLIVSVYPNPSHSGISFSIANQETSNVEVSLININGIILHKEIFKSVAANTTNKLSLDHQPAAGVYILKLKAKDISESMRVIIE